MRYVLQILGVAGEQINPEAGDPSGMFIRIYEPEAHYGWGEVEVTAHIEDALHFDSITEAIECWQKVPVNRPRRPDGQPNRPLTAYTVTTIEVPDSSVTEP